MFPQLTQKVSTAMLLTCIALLLSAKSFAQTTTYTAIANGNYTSASTWQGGNVPPAQLYGNSTKVEVIIPMGITVILDTNIITEKYNNPSLPEGKLTVNGTLNGLPGRFLSGGLNGGTSAIVNIDSSELMGFYGGIDFKGTMTTNSCFMRNYTFSGTLNIKNALSMHQASDVNQVLGSLNFSNHCWIKSEGRCRFYTTGSGVVTFADTMNLSYKHLWHGGTNFNLDIDTNYIGRQIDSFVIDLDTNYAPPQSPWGLSIAHKDLYFNGVLILNSGQLRLNHYNITFGPNAKVFCKRNKGFIEAEKDANITINATSDFGTGLLFYKGDVFRPAKDTVKNLTLNMGNSTGITKIVNGMTVANTLDLKKGRLHIDTSKVHLQSGSSATITNAGINSYITSSYGGELHMDVATNGTATFPVGTPIHYAPIDVKNNSSSMEVYKVGSVAGVLDSATRGFDIASQEPCVGATWWVSPSATSGSSADITIKWPAALEVNSFNRAQSFITTYLHSQTKWDTQTSTGAATQSGNFYTHTETVNNFSTTNSNYFSVFDGMTSLANLSVNPITANNKTTLYPNPTSGNATLSLSLEKAEILAIQLVDISGQIVYIQKLQQYTQGTHDITLPTKGLLAAYIYTR